MSAARVMLWVQHLMGIGHQRRAAVIARRLCRQGAAVCYVSGGYPVPDLDTGPATFVQLPPARAADLSYRALADAEGRDVTPAWESARRERLLQVFDAFRPDVLVTETFPFGRGLLRFELEPLIERVYESTPRPRLWSSVRDIVQPKSAKRNAAVAALAASRFDAVLVHADPAVVRLESSFPDASRIADRIRYTGYVVESHAAAEARAGEDFSGVLVSAGGGMVAKALLEAALEARPLSHLADVPWLVLAGAGVSEPEFRRLRGRAGEGLRVERNRSDFPSLLETCTVSVSQAGYNTLLDVVRARARAVVVPFSDAGQTEQPLRARLFERKGLVRVLDPGRLQPRRLAAAIDSAATSDRPPTGSLDVNGAEQSAEMILAACGGHR